MCRSALATVRRISRSLLLACCLVAVASGARAQQCGICGDVNGDGVVDIIDALFIAQNTVGLRPVLPCPAQGDVKPDQHVDIVDALFVAQFTVNTRPILCFRIDSPAPQSLFSTSLVPVSGTLTGQASVACNGIAATVGTGGFSASVPLQEGNTTIACVAQDGSGHVASATESVTLDTTPPRVVIAAPADGATVSASPIAVSGMVNDIVVGTVNGGQAALSCNGIAAQIANRTFSVAGIGLSPGLNAVTCTAIDRAGNLASTTIAVDLDTSLRARINQISGNLQSGQIGTALPNPLVVSLTDDAGHPVAGKPVIFKVVENDGTLSGGAMSGRAVAVITDASGQAHVQFTLGTRAGAGNNQVQAVAVGFAGQAVFSASATTAPAARLVVDAGNNQRGAVAQALPLPFTAAVIDSGNNRLPNVPITFTVTLGGGSIGGETAVTVNTDSDGRAQAVLTLGSAAGVENNIAVASFAGNTGPPAVFVASGMLPGNPANTSISGVVLDNTNTPMPGASLIIANTTLNTISDGQGQFRISGVPVGLVRLFVDGSTVQRPGSWPNLEFSLITVAGQNNTVERGTIYLLPLEIPGGQPDENKLCVDATHGGTITVPEVPGFAFTIAPGSATFPNGLKTGCITATPVHPDKMPKVPNFGQQPQFAVTIQPAGTRFDPPAPLAIPNADGLLPGQKTDMYSYDHDLEQFVSIGTGTVSDDGTLVRSDPGVGVIKAGWHCGGNPSPTGECEHKCNDNNGCTKDSMCIDLEIGPVEISPHALLGGGIARTGGPTCDPQGCLHEPLPDNTACPGGVGGLGLDCGDGQVDLQIDDSCNGVCQQGQCTSAPFNSAQIAAAAAAAISKICSDPCIMGDDLRDTMTDCLKRKGFSIKCETAAPSNTTSCAQAGIPRGCYTFSGLYCANSATVFSNAFNLQGCTVITLPSILLHEMVHAVACDPGDSGHDTNAGTFAATDKEYGCEEACFPNTSGGRGNPAACQ